MEELLKSRKEVLYHYSPYSFLPKPDKEKIFNHSIIELQEKLLNDDNVQRLKYTVKGHEHYFIVKYLPWDTAYFNMPTYKLIFVHYGHTDGNILKKAVNLFTNEFFSENNRYCFTEIPSEDIWLIQALNESAFKLVETRLTYYLDLVNFKNERYEVREATSKDTENLKRVAREMRNDYDRFHADSIFDLKQADEFLATYIENSIKGFADIIIVPSGKSVPSDAFLTANYLKDEWESIGERISKMVLSAVSAETCKGWYIKLISEMAYHLKEIGAHYAFMHPATTNRAVIHSYEKLGCKYGKAVHVLSKNNMKHD